MNCSTCRRHLDPFLDDELEFQVNLDVLAHLNLCPGCQRGFENAARSRERLVAAFADEGAPPALRRRIHRELAATDRGLPLRILRFALPVAAAAGVVALLSLAFDGLREGPSTPKAPNSEEVASIDPEIEMAGPPMRRVGWPAPSRPFERATLDDMLTDLFGAEAPVPNALALDGGPPLRTLVGRIGLPAIEALVRDLDDATFVARLRRSMPREESLSPKPIAGGLELAFCCDERVLTVQRPGEAPWLVVHSEPGGLKPLVDLLEGH